MGGTDMNEFYRVLGETLQPLDVEYLKFLLANNFTGKFHWAVSLSFPFGHPTLLLK